MDRLDLYENADFGADKETWLFLQSQSHSLQPLTAIVGDTYILSGLEGADSLGDGYIVYQGELLPFKGGAQEADCQVVEAAESAVYRIDADKDKEYDHIPTYKRRYACFASRALEEGEAIKKKFAFSQLKPFRDLLKLEADIKTAFAEVKTGRQALTSDDLQARHPQLELYHFSALKNEVGCVTLSLAGTLSGYEAPCGFVNLLTLPKRLSAFCLGGPPFLFCELRGGQKPLGCVSLPNSPTSPHRRGGSIPLLIRSPGHQQKPPPPFFNYLYPLSTMAIPSSQEAATLPFIKGVERRLCRFIRSIRPLQVSPILDNC